MIGTKHLDRGSVITPLITSISAFGTLSKLLWLQSDRPCPAEMISLWKWVQVPHQLYLVWEKEHNEICSLSVVTYTVILCRCNSPGAAGAADILRAGDWASDWSRLHSSPRRSCPARTQGAGLTIYPLIPTGFRKKNPILSVFYLMIQSLLTQLSYTHSPRWHSWPVTSILSLWRRWAWPLSCTTTSSRWPS